VRSAPCTRRRGARVSWFDLKTMVDDFSQFGLKIDVYGFLGLASKPRSMVSPDLVSNRWLWFLWFGLKTTLSGFPIWASKSAAVVW
jgi:hypothetical protein